MAVLNPTQTKNKTPQTLTYPIVETFHSVQGEGSWMGTNAFFIRLAGCDVHCPWCDTKESWNAQHHPHQTLTELAMAVQRVNPALIVITGGEPLVHDLLPLTQHLKSLGCRLHLETSGAHAMTGEWDWVTFSPKRYKSPHRSIYERTHELKVVVAQADDLEWAREQAEWLKTYHAQPETVVKYLQPEWNTPTSEALVFDYVLEHPEWRVSLQTHKLMGVR